MKANNMLIVSENVKKIAYLSIYSSCIEGECIFDRMEFDSYFKGISLRQIIDKCINLGIISFASSFEDYCQKVQEQHDIETIINDDYQTCYCIEQSHGNIKNFLESKYKSNNHFSIIIEEVLSSFALDFPIMDFPVYDDMCADYEESIGSTHKRDLLCEEWRHIIENIFGRSSNVDGCECQTVLIVAMLLESFENDGIKCMKNLLNYLKENFDEYDAAPKEQDILKNLMDDFC